MKGKIGRFFTRDKNGKFASFEPKLLVKKTSDNLAELIGIILGDGNIYVRKRTKTFQVRIVCNKITDKKYLLNHVGGLFEKLFNVQYCIQFQKGKQAIRLSIGKKNVIYTLLYYGLVSGNKCKNNVGIPRWIFKKKSFMKSCIRGLIDTDGSIYPKTKNHKTPTIWFNSSIPKLRNDFKKCLTILKYKSSKWTNRGTRGYGINGQDSYQCSIGDRIYVFKYFKEIGFGNPKHQKRFKKFWKIAPIV